MGTFKKVLDKHWRNRMERNLCNLNFQGCRSNKSGCISFASNSWALSREEVALMTAELVWEV